ncbi:MAG: MBL fold metallo-hydrolase [Bdellovibrionales bacterium]|nr:MBL fold metallo-hydrolase [Bdellovibrionales bacterium]
MLEFCLLSSGSRANAIYVAAGSTRVLIDCGLSAKQAAMRLRSIDVDPDSIDAIVLTHEHDDHVCGVRVFAKRHKTTVLANRQTMGSSRHLAEIPLEQRGEFDSGAPFKVGELTFDPFSISHDASDPVAFRVSAGERTLGVVTDLGQVTTLVEERVRNLDALILESNHDPGMLFDAPYPWDVKQRISGRHGHLSNATAGEVLEEISRSDGSRLRYAVAAHISENSNRPDLALHCFRTAWARGGQLHCPEFHAAGVLAPSPLFRL